MAYPTTIDSLTTPTANQKLNNPSHSAIEGAQNTAITALETKVGVDSSAVATTIDYLLKNSASSNPGHKHTFSSLTDFTITSPSSGQFLTYNGSKWVNSLPNIKFGGTGADGALNISSGTISIDCASAALVVKNYTAIAITGTGKLTFINPNAAGTTIILKSQGNVTITSSTVPAIDLRSVGGAGGAGSGNSGGTGPGGGGGASLLNSGSAGGSGSSGGTGSAGTASAGIVNITAGGAGAGSTAGAGGVTPFIYNYSFALTSTKSIFLAPASGGGGGGAGGASGSTAGAGGAGAGALYIECGGAYSATSTINAGGVAGGNSTNGNSGSGGGGGGGLIIILYQTLTSDTGTYTVTGGAGGTNGGSPAGGGGGNGFSFVGLNTNFS